MAAACALLAASNKAAPVALAADAVSGAVAYAQAVQNKAMPLGNQTGMTEAERATLGRWVKALP